MKIFIRWGKRVLFLFFSFFFFFCFSRERGEGELHTVERCLIVSRESPMGFSVSSCWLRGVWREEEAGRRIVKSRPGSGCLNDEIFHGLTSACLEDEWHGRLEQGYGWRDFPFFHVPTFLLRHCTTSRGKWQRKCMTMKNVWHDNYDDRWPLGYFKYVSRLVSYSMNWRRKEFLFYECQT